MIVMITGTEKKLLHKGSFTNYVDKILAFFTTYPPPFKEVHVR